MILAHLLIPLTQVVRASNGREDEVVVVNAMRRMREVQVIVRTILIASKELGLL